MRRSAACILVCLVLGSSSSAVCRGAEILASTGWYKRYLDEPMAFAYGLAISVPIANRVSVRPEFMVDTGKQYSHVLALGSVTGDFTDPRKATAGYWVASAGGVRSREESFAFTPWRWAALGGAGVRFVIKDRWIAAAEFRAGLPAFPLLTFNVGYRWGKESIMRTFAFILAGLVAGTVCCHAQATPTAWDVLSAIEPGHTIRVETSTRKHTGSFAGATGEAIRLDSDSGQISFTRTEVVRVYSKSRSNRLRNTLIGAGIGTAIGVTAYGTIGQLFRNEGGEDTGALLAAPVAIGTIVGAVIPTGSMQKVYDAKQEPSGR